MTRITNSISAHDGPSTPNRRFLLILIVIVAGLLAGCGPKDGTSDAYGNFEATEIIVSAEVAGRIVSLSVEEGVEIPKGEVVGYIDTVQLALQRDQLIANREGLGSRIGSVSAQIEVLEEQKRVASVELARVQRLIANQAATQKQLDDVEGQIAILDRQIASTRSQNATIRKEIKSIDVQIEILEDRLRRSIIVNPVSGTVLVKYVEQSELTGVGNPIYKIADLGTVFLRAYVSGDQLPQLRQGQHVTVLIDEDRTSNRTLDGVVSWIASEAEFTPKTIQTKEERVNLVYAFKVRVSNPDGYIKIGMPGEVRFSDTND